MYIFAFPINFFHKRVFLPKSIESFLKISVRVITHAIKISSYLSEEKILSGKL